MNFPRLSRLLRVELKPPAYLSVPTVGIDISMSGIKFALLTEGLHGLELAAYGERHFPAGAFVNGDIVNGPLMASELSMLAKEHGFSHANVALPEAKGYLFETDVPGEISQEWRTAVEQHLDEYVPLPPADVTFDIVSTETKEHETHVVGVGYARRVIQETLAVLDSAGIQTRALEAETFAIPRALLLPGTGETVLILDIGKTSSKIMIVENCVPRFTTTLTIGGHALTLAVQKHFGVTEAEAREIKITQGLISGSEGDDYVASLLSTVSVIRDEVGKRLEYWQTRAASIPGLSPVSRMIITGGNASFVGLAEYLETGLNMPVSLADVFTNFAPRSDWLPPLDYMESLAYATAIGLALRDTPAYAK